jgi:superfamily II DNA or RNA helicase
MQIIAWGRIPLPENLTKRAVAEQVVAEAEARVARLESELQRAIRSLDASRAELEHLRDEEARTAPFAQVADGTPRSNAEKVELFRSLFRGRDDVFPRLWTNPKSGKHGYSPACANEWLRGVCEKPRVKCGECPHQAFVPVDARAILDHLRGAHVIGVYPLLADETCWFLAIDLDKASWKEDVAALRATCEDLGLHPAVERSRSGNGAHVWFFFSVPVAASTARRMGCHVITETMSRRHQLSMQSYDRLFPNQDTMPRGGFGNLIALPFQDGPRREGNTVFLDERLASFPDQWAYLAAIPKLDSQVVDRIATEAQSRGLVVGVRAAGFADEDVSLVPWDRLPSRFPPRPQITEPLPKLIRAVLAQRLFLEKVGVPSSLLNQIKRLAAFQNPEFFKRQNLRLSTALTPRVISCAEDLSEYVALPRGCLSDLDTLLREYGVQLAIEDKRVDGEALDVTFRGTLTTGQMEAARALLAHENGVLVAPPGTGKTVVGVFLAARRRRSTLILVHRRPLLEQWVAQLAIFLGISPDEIGRIGAGKNRPTGRLDVAMLQSLVRGERVDDLVAGYGHVIVDECHHVPAVSFERVMREAKARFITGLTATPQRRDGHHPILEMQLGPIRHAVDSRSRGAPSFTRQLLVRETSFKLPVTASSPAIQDIYRFLAEDAARNSLIVDDVISAIESGRSPIVLTERRDHVEALATELGKAIRNVVVLQGGMSEKVRREVTAQIENIPRDQERVILATGRFAGEGFDDPRLDTLFLALPVSWKGTLIQYAGRLHRHLPEKTDVRIYDYVDAGVPLLARMFQKRLRGYRAMGYGLDAGRQAASGR